MGKGKRRVFNDPAEQLKKINLADNWRKGILTRIPDGRIPDQQIEFDAGIKPRVGYQIIGTDGTEPAGDPVIIKSRRFGSGIFDESGTWDQETLKKILEFQQISEQFKEPVDPIKEWCDKWMEGNNVKQDAGALPGVE